MFIYVKFVDVNTAGCLSQVTEGGQDEGRPLLAAAGTAALKPAETETN